MMVSQPIRAKGKKKKRVAVYLQGDIISRVVPQSGSRLIRGCYHSGPNMVSISDDKLNIGMEKHAKKITNETFTMNADKKTVKNQIITRKHCSDLSCTRTL